MSLIFRPDDWLWCTSCQRVYLFGEYRNQGRLRLCPYANCDGVFPRDCLLWSDLKKQRASYPVVPDRDRVYPLYGA